MATSWQNATNLVFEYKDDTVIVSFAKNADIVRIEDKINLTPISAQQKSYPMKNSIPLNVMQEMLEDFKKVFLFAGSTLSKVIDETMLYFNTFDTMSLQQKENALNVVVLRKFYAKYFYTILKNKGYKISNSGTDNSLKTEDKKKTSQIIIELVSWYYIRRFVHIYVVCTCLEKLIRLSIASTQASSSVAPNQGFTSFQPKYNTTVQPTGANIPSTSTPQVPKVNPAVVTQQISLLDRQLQMLQGSPTVLPDTSGLAKALKDTQELLSAQQQENKVLQQDVDDARKELQNLRELLLSSTSMIFQMDELLPTS